MLQKLYTVVPNDTLSSIAIRYGLSSWKEIYYHPANASFRNLRNNPNSIQPGDQLIIPPSALALAKEQLKILQEIRRDATLSFDNIERELAHNYSKVKSNIMIIDAIAWVTMIVKDLGMLVHKGYQSLQLSGEALSKLNNEMAKSALTIGPSNAVSIISSTFTITGEEPLAWAIPKILLKSWSDMTTPSYWAGRILGYTPDSIFSEVKNHNQRIKNQVIANIDKKIMDKMNEIAKLEQLKASSYASIP